MATLIVFSLSGVTRAADLDCTKDVSPAGKALFCGGAATLANNDSTLSVVINIVANWLIGIMGLVLAVMILISAVQVVSSSGNPDAVKSAKNRLTQAAISLGLLVSFRAILALIGI